MTRKETRQKYELYNKYGTEWNNEDSFDNFHKNSRTYTKKR